MTEASWTLRVAHKNVIIMYKINNTNLVVAQMTKWLNGHKI